MSKDSEHFDSRGRFIYLWRVKAASLREAARLVWQGGMIQLEAEDGSSHELQLLHGPARLLMGLCLEVALKGLLVERNPKLVSGGKIESKLKTHSLEELFQAASIPLIDTEKELNFVRRLSDGVEWVARYPIPVKASQLRSPKHASKNTLHQYDGDFARFEELWQRVDAKYETTSTAPAH